MRQMRPRDNVVLHDRDQWSSSWAEPIKFGRSPSNTVPKEGLEPSHPKAQEPKSCVSTSSTTPAHLMLLCGPTRVSRGSSVQPAEA